MKICENCGQYHNGEYGSGRFCSSKCARGFSTKIKRNEINIKISKSNTGKIHTNETKLKISINNGSRNPSTRKKISDGVKKSMTNEVKSKISNRMKNRVISDETKKKLSKIAKKRCESVDERKRLEEIGRIGGFGKKGYTKMGTFFSSTLEEKCFNYLETNKINFIPHKPIPNSSKISDIYLSNFDIWIELDGINREKKKKWLGKNYEFWIEKLDIYKKNNLNFKIIYNISEFIEYINKLNIVL